MKPSAKIVCRVLVRLLTLMAGFVGYSFVVSRNTQDQCQFVPLFVYLYATVLDTTGTTLAVLSQDVLRNASSWFVDPL